MQYHSKVLTITMNPSVDVSSETEKVSVNQKVRCTTPQIDPGGGGINVARVLHRLEVNTDALYVAGGHTGIQLKKMIDQEGINSIIIQNDDLTRENVSIIENETGHQFRFVFPGSISDVSVYSEVLSTLTRILTNYDYVVASGSLPKHAPIDFYAQLAEIVLNEQKQFILDASGDSLRQGLANGATYIKPNQEEFEDLKQLYGLQTDEALCAYLFEHGVKHIIHTLGKDETRLISPDSIHSFTPPNIEVRSSVGAGDSFIGGLIAGLAKGLSEEKAVGYGISAAASTLQSEGTDLCDKDEVEQIFKMNF